MAVNMQELEREHDRRGIKITELERTIKELEKKPEHTPREIVEQCKLRWDISLDDLLDRDSYTFDEDARIGVEMEELKQWLKAADCILDEFEKEGV